MFPQATVGQPPGRIANRRGHRLVARVVVHTTSNAAQPPNVVASVAETVMILQYIPLSESPPWQTQLCSHRPIHSEAQMSVIDIRLDRINGTAIQWFTARTDEPRAAIVANIVVNKALPAERIHQMDTLPTAAGAVVIGYERLCSDRPDIKAMVREVSIEPADVEHAIEHIFEAVGPAVEQERRRSLRLELDACETVKAAHYHGHRPVLSERLQRHLPPQFHTLLTAEDPDPQGVESLTRHVERCYEDLFCLLLGPDLYARTAPDQLPERELRATMYGPTLGPGLGLPE